MSTRTKKTVATSLWPEEVVALDRVRKRDNLTRAQALREAIRRYVSHYPDRQIPVEDALSDEIEAIEEGQAQIARGEYVLLNDLKDEMGRSSKAIGQRERAVESLSASVGSAPSEAGRNENRHRE